MKICKKFLKKIAKCIILAYFSKNFKTPALILLAFGRKIQIVGENFKKMLKNFNENSIEKLNFFDSDLIFNVLILYCTA